MLVALAGMGIALSPPYVTNFRFQQYLEDLSADPANAAKPPEQVRVQVLERAARMGLPVRADQIRVSTGGDRARIEVRYAVRVDFPLYTVDLHFRPKAGGR